MKSNSYVLKENDPVGEQEDEIFESQLASCNAENETD